MIRNREKFLSLMESGIELGSINGSNDLVFVEAPSLSVIPMLIANWDYMREVSPSRFRYNIIDLVEEFNELLMYSDELREEVCEMIPGFDYIYLNYPSTLLSVKRFMEYANKHYLKSL